MTEAQTWHLTSLDLAVVFDRLGRDRVPFPFTWSTDARTADDLYARRLTARQRVDKEPLLTAVSMLGSDGPQITACGASTDDRRIRVRAAVTGSRAVVIVQDSGLGADVHVHAVSAGVMTRIVAAALPSRPAGKLRSSCVDRAELTDTPSSYLHGSDGDDDRRRVISVLDGPRDGLGEFVVGTAVDVDGPLDVRAGHRWIDATNDGRYLVTVGAQIAVSPATAESIATTLDGDVQRVARIPVARS